MNPEHSLKLFGVGFTAVGLAAVAFGLFGMIHHPIFLFFLFLGLLFASIGGGVLLAPVIGRARRRRILAGGIPVTATVLEVKPDPSFGVVHATPDPSQRQPRQSWSNPRGVHRWVILAECPDKSLGDGGLFISHPVWVHPEPAYAAGSQVTVHYLPQKPWLYTFDLSRLPAAEAPEVCPPGWTVSQIGPPLPKEIMVEERGDGVRYTLPGGQVLEIAHGKLRGRPASGIFGKFSRPAHRVRRLLVWSMGIWVECSGWYPSAPVLVSYDSSRRFDGSLVLALAHELANRLRGIAVDPKYCRDRPVVVKHGDIGA